MPEWLSGPLRGVSFLALWTLVVVWSIAAPVIGILSASYFLQHPTERIFVPLAIIVTIYLTVRGARLLMWLAERAMQG